MLQSRIKTIGIENTAHTSSEILTFPLNDSSLFALAEFMEMMTGE
jgi:hypothetical protein